MPCRWLFLRATTMAARLCSTGSSFPAGRRSTIKKPAVRARANTALSMENKTHWPNLKQGSEEWLQLRQRCGVTGSRLACVLGLGYLSRNAYMRLKLGVDPPPEVNDLMRFGTDNEDYVCDLYLNWMLENNQPIELIEDGFKLCPDDLRSGASVDRLVRNTETGEMWILEIKCKPKGNVRDSVPISHLLQCIFNAVCHGASFADYCSWSPEVEKMFISRIHFNKEHLWDNFLLPRVRVFNDMWERKEYYPRMKRGEAKSNEDVVRALSTTSPIISFAEDSIGGNGCSNAK